MQSVWMWSQQQVAHHGAVFVFDNVVAVYGRYLTAFITLLLPLLATALGKPPRLSSGGLG